MFEWTSSFLMNPAMAAGAGAVAAPILIHLFARRRFRRVRWAAMDFLLEAQRRNRRRVRLEQLLLLLLRCLAVLLIAFMIMRPFVRPGAFASILGASGRTERVVILDDSYSMDYRPISGGDVASRTVFERACDAVLQLARWASEEAPGDTLTLRLTSRPGDPLIALKSLSEDELERLRRELTGLRVSEATARVADAVSATADALARSPTQANTAVYIVSDFQRHDWIRPSAASEESGSVLAPLSSAVKVGASVKIVLLNVGDAAAENAAIIDVTSQRPQCIAGVPARFEVAVANHTPRAMEQVELGVTISEHRLPPVVVNRIAPGQTVREPIEITFPRDGSNYVRVELMAAERFGDSVRLDNARTATVDVVPVMQVLIVNGEASNDPYRDEVFLLRTALRPEGRAASGNELTVIDEGELETAELEPYHVVMLANVGRLGTGAVRNLDAFVRGGGGLIIFAGDQLDIDHYNAELHRNGLGILPVLLGDMAEVPESAERVTFFEWNTDHPVMRAFEGPLAELLRQVRLSGYITSDAVDAETVDSTLSQGVPLSAEARPNGANGSVGAAPVQVLARLNDAFRTAAIVQKRVERGLSIWIATSADQEWNDWASNFSYLPMMLELVQHCAKSSADGADVSVGSPLVFEFDARRHEPRAALRTPAYPIEPDFTLEATDVLGERATLVFRETTRSGVHELHLKGRDGGASVRFAAVNPDPAESDLAVAGRTELETALAEDMVYEYVADVSILSDRTAGARRELWWPLLMCAVLVLMCEQSLAWWFGTRGV